VIGGVAGTLAADFLYNNFVGWLTFLSISLPAIGGIIIGDFFFTWKRSFPSAAKHPFEQLRLPALIAWGAALAASALSPASGPFCVAPLNSIVTALVVYVVADRLLAGKRE
ncbi:MAG: cytosine permease, partial [Deltaproteobacteria bacterium]|nr:cytosine permease [Deltaproteobacteria bacterium]